MFDTNFYDIKKQRNAYKNRKEATKAGLFKTEKWKAETVVVL